MAASPDEVAALEEERDFLLRSLTDLDRELEAGDIDEADHATLHADYTTRAAEVLRALDGDAGAGSSAESLPRGPWSKVLAAGLVAVVAVLAGVLVMQSAGQRGSAGPTGLDVSAASSRVQECQAMEIDGDTEGALACYDEILESLPGNVPALTFRGWLQVREFDVADGLTDLDAAIQLDPDSTAPYVFRASARSRSDDAPGAVADLAVFYANDPGDEERALADQFAPAIVDAALDVCIDGDVTGSMDPVTVLECYRSVLDVDPDSSTAKVYMGWLLARGGATDQAMDLLDAGLATDPELSAGYVFRAALRGHLGDEDGARDDLAVFDGLDAPDDQIAAARSVEATLDAGDDPLPG